MLAGRSVVLGRQTPSCTPEHFAGLAYATSASRSTFRARQLWDTPIRRASTSSSSSRWLARQSRDPFTRSTRVDALKSRAAYKLLEIDQKYHLFRPGQTVVDLGFAPGSWSQVAISRVRPVNSKRWDARVVGIDLIPARPPRGVSAIQGNFLNPETRDRVIAFVRDPQAGRARPRQTFARRDEDDTELMEDSRDSEELQPENEATGESSDDVVALDKADRATKTQVSDRDEMEGRVVDVVLSDITRSEPWPLVNVWTNSVVNPYRRMMNTSGNSFKDHAGSMDLCMAALTFAYDTLKQGGSLLCKFYQGGEDKQFETRLKKLFEKVHRIKPDSSRKESREAYFLALHRQTGVPKEHVFGQP